MEKITTELVNEKLREIVERLKYNIDPQKIILFGSYAYGQPVHYSDIDLLIIDDKMKHFPRYKRSIIVRKYLRKLKIPVDLIVYDNNEIKKWENNNFAFITTIIRKGKVIYERK